MENDVILHPPFYKYIVKAMLPLFSITVGILSLVSYFNGREAIGLLSSYPVRAAICFIIAVFSLRPFFNQDLITLTNKEISQRNKWNLFYSDIKTVDLGKRFYGQYIIITPKINPDYKIFIYQTDVNMKISLICDELVKRIKANKEKI